MELNWMSNLKRVLIQMPIPRKEKELLEIYRHENKEIRNSKR